MAAGSFPLPCPGRGAGRELLSAVGGFASGCAAGMDSGKTKRSDPSVCTLGCVLLLALRPVLDGLGGADLQEARDVREPEEACSEAGVAVLPGSPARPLSSSSEVDSDEFYEDQTPKPPKPMKKPTAKIKPAGKAKGVKG